MLAKPSNGHEKARSPGNEQEHSSKHSVDSTSLVSPHVVIARGPQVTPAGTSKRFDVNVSQRAREQFPMMKPRWSAPVL